jgi:tripartite-type tricarboxylate transporter receptor subunit TctC
LLSSGRRRRTEVDAANQEPSGIVTSKDRPEAMKDIPFAGSVAEGFEYDSWLGLIAPKGLPPEVLERLSRAIHESVASPEFAARMTPLGATARASTPAELRARVERDIAHFKRIVAARSIAPE